MDFTKIIEFVEKIGYTNTYLIIGLAFILLIMAFIYFITYIGSNIHHSSIRELTLYRKYHIVAMSAKGNPIQTHIVRAFGRLNATDKVVNRFYKTNFKEITFRVVPLHSKKPLKALK
jgi:hypothetical protein